MEICYFLIGSKGNCNSHSVHVKDNLSPICMAKKYTRVHLHATASRSSMGLTLELFYMK